MQRAIIWEGRLPTRWNRPEPKLVADEFHPLYRIVYPVVSTWGNDRPTLVVEQASTDSMGGNRWEAMDAEDASGVIEAVMLLSLGAGPCASP